MFVNRRELTIEWGDCDPAGIVFYPRFLAMFDASTAALFAAALGYNKREMLRRFGIAGFPMVDVGAKFYLPSRFGDIVSIESSIQGFGRSSFEVQHRLTRDGVLAVECREKRVWAGLEVGSGLLKSLAVPQEVRDALSTRDQATGSA